MAKMCTVLLKDNNGVTFVTKDERDEVFIKQKALDIFNVTHDKSFTMDDVVRIVEVVYGASDEQINPREDVIEEEPPIEEEE